MYYYCNYDYNVYYLILFTSMLWHLCAKHVGGHKGNTCRKSNLFSRLNTAACAVVIICQTQIELYINSYLCSLNIHWHIIMYYIM